MAYPPCSTPPTERPSCSVCGEAAVSRCDECSPDGKLFLCGQAECFDKMHNAFNAAKHQQLLVPWDSRKKWTPKCCATHTNKLLEYWCDLCRVPVCDKCYSHGEHVGHATSLIPDVCQALQQDLQAKAEQLDAEIERGSGRLAQLARLRDEATRREGSVGAAMRALDEAEKQFGDKMRALRAELEASAVSWHDRAQKEHEELAARMASVRALAENLRASCNEEEAQRVAVEYNEQCKQREALRVPLPSLVVCEVGVPPDALTALQAAVVGLVVTSDGVVSCATCKQEDRESSMQVCGCEQKACSALCVAACLTCVKVEKDALPLALQHKVALPNVTPESQFILAAETCKAIAEVWRGVENRDEEGRLLLKARVILESKAPNSLDLADTYDSLGRVFAQQGNYNEAPTWFEKARVILESKAPNSIVLAETYNGLGRVFLQKDNYNEAMTWFEKARVILESKAPNSIVLAETYNGLGRVFSQQGNFSEAQTWYEKARVIRESKAPNSLDLADTYDSLGRVFSKQGNYNEAPTWFHKARVIRESKAPNSIVLAETYNGLGRVFSQQVICNEAQRTWFEKARVILESEAPNSLDLADTYDNLGCAFTWQGNSNEATTWFDKADVIRAKAPNTKSGQQDHTSQRPFGL